MFCVWQFCFRRAWLSRFIHRFPSNQGQTHCFDFVCQLSPICNSPVDTPMIISSFIFAVNTCYQHDKLFTRRQIQIVLILFQSHCSGFQKHPCCQLSQFVKIYYSQCTSLKVETQLLIESVPCFIFCEVMYDLDVSVKFRSDQN
jgi:hypothetical protein